MRAYRQVLSNKGSAGVGWHDRKRTERTPEKNRERSNRRLRQGRYLPQAILGVEIPKSNGKTQIRDSHGYRPAFTTSE
jgi:RNA-directed DNA polymerase